MTTSGRFDLPANAEPAAVADTSVAVPLMLGAHPAHAECRNAVRHHRAGLAGHAWFESMAVLTRLPSPHRLSTATAHRLLTHNFRRVFWLGAADAEQLAGELSEHLIGGGAVYDALVAASARAAGLPVLSRDRRAQATYERLGVGVILLTAP